MAPMVPASVRAVKIFINESTPGGHRKAVQTQALLTFNWFLVSCACLHLQWENTSAVHSAATIPDHVSSQKTFLSIILLPYCVLSTEHATDNVSSVLERQSHTVCRWQHSQARVCHQLVQHCILTLNSEVHAQWDRRQSFTALYPSSADVHLSRCTLADAP